MASVTEKLTGESQFLPNEIIVEILSKVAELRTLCICKSVSKRFNQIACQVTCLVDTISFMAPSSWKTNDSKFHEHIYSFALLKHHKWDCYDNPYGFRFDRFVDGLIESMTKFTRLKSLYIELPLSSFDGLPFLKWKVSIASNRIKSFVILSPTSIHDKNRTSYNDREKEKHDTRSGCHISIARICLEEAFVRYMMLFGFSRECPFLEKISITDRCKRGRISLSGAKLFKVINSLTAPPKVDDFLYKLSRCDIPMLDLPVSELVMKGVELILYEDEHLPSGYSYDRYVNIDDDDEDVFNDKEEAAYSEAVMEIFKKHRSKISVW